MGAHPMHKFFAYDPAKHVLVMTPRDPKDLQEMPPNGNHHVTAKCLRGVRKVGLSFLSESEYHGNRSNS
jgi:hypothetical protein